MLTQQIQPPENDWRRNKKIIKLHTQCHTVVGWFTLHLTSVRFWLHLMKSFIVNISSKMDGDRNRLIADEKWPWLTDRRDLPSEFNPLQDKRYWAALANVFLFSLAEVIMWKSGQDVAFPPSTQANILDWKCIPFTVTPRFWLAELSRGTGTDKRLPVDTKGSANCPLRKIFSWSICCNLITIVETLQIVVSFSPWPQNNMNCYTVSERGFRFYAQAHPF